MFPTPSRDLTSVPKLTSADLAGAKIGGNFPRERRERMSQFAALFRGGVDGSRMDAGASIYAHAPNSLLVGHGRPGTNMDAADSIFIARQLEEIRAGLYEVKYGKLKAERITPFNTAIDRGVEDYTVRAIDHSAQPVPAKAGEKNIPTLRMRVTAQTAHMESWYLAYEYTLQEMHAAAYAGLPLSANLAMLCRERMARMLDQLALVGDLSNITAVKGVFTQTLESAPGDAGVLNFTAPADGTASATNAEAKTSDQVIRDMRAPISKVVTNSREIERPDTLVIPVSYDEYIAGKRVGDGTSWTIKAFFQENNKDIDLECSTWLESVGASGTDVDGPDGSKQRRMAAYANDPTRFEIDVSVLFDQTAPQFHMLSVNTITEIRTAGASVYLPKSICYQDGV